MTTRATLLALASRVEAAMGADRELDKAIARAIDFFAGTRSSYDLQLNLIPRYTASIDAAMSLVPSGHRFAMWPRDNDRTCVQMWHSDRRYCGFGLDVPEATASTPALALTSASLRAIAGSMTE